MPILMHHNPPGDRRVFLAIPSYGPVTAGTAFCLFRSHAALLAAGYTVELGLLSGDCHVDDARNRLVGTFLRSACDDFVFVDSDIGWADGDLVRLLAHDRDIVGGSYPMKQPIEDFPVRFIGGEIWSDSDGLIEVEGLPTGFLRIRRPVLEKLASEAQEYKVHGSGQEPCRLIFERLIVNGGRMSGDYAFCRKARAAGFKIFADPDCLLEHSGEKTWSGTLGTHLRRKNGLALVDGIGRIKNRTDSAATLLQLIMEWGNDPWSAGPELLHTCIQVARQIDGPVLETGSGLTTLAMAAANPGVTVHSLEHNDEWAARTAQAAERLGLTNIVIHRERLVQYPAGKWYSIPRLPWQDFQLVLCDGPPRWEGARRILFGVMATNDCRPRCILVDDADTEGDALPADYRTEIKGQIRKFAIGLR